MLLSSPIELSRQVKTLPIFHPRLDRLCMDTDSIHIHQTGKLCLKHISHAVTWEDITKLRNCSQAVILLAKEDLKYDNLKPKLVNQTNVVVFYKKTQIMR